MTSPTKYTASRRRQADDLQMPSSFFPLLHATPTAVTIHNSPRTLNPRPLRHRKTHRTSAKSETSSHIIFCHDLVRLRTQLRSPLPRGLPLPPGLIIPHAYWKVKCTPYQFIHTYLHLPTHNTFSRRLVEQKRQRPAAFHYGEHKQAAHCGPGVRTRSSLSAADGRQGHQGLRPGIQGGELALVFSVAFEIHLMLVPLTDRSNLSSLLPNNPSHHYHRCPTCVIMSVTHAVMVWLGSPTSTQCKRRGNLTGPMYPASLDGGTGLRLLPIM